jgi:hypothetical protein
MATRLLNYRGVKKKGQVSWTVHVSFVLLYVILYLTVFTFVKGILGLIILGACVFCFCYLLFNKHPVHMMLTLKAYLRESRMSPTPVDTLKVNGLREIPSLNRVINKLSKR